MISHPKALDLSHQWESHLVLQLWDLTESSESWKSTIGLVVLCLPGLERLPICDVSVPLYGQENRTGDKNLETRNNK